ncbi:hypothetical protein [Flavisolibacter ginsenosidimutans]|uniref:Cytochrome c domain-containing protein n=1 Tax=Flavisolibacter ginsenosidimutans TaxID=661481 RepID=A0A5B8UES1_9BACT|nr:hypothetical protein [Flavisolibacter ginsenosidimutans]QEC55181.1 hypothetical protein FSB75_04425 [Flavisolibacter ginsenosidimutans]
MKKISFLLLFLVAIIAAGCYYNNEEQLYNCPVDAASTKYSTTVANILTSYGCTGCHVAPVPSGNIDLSSYAGVKVVAGDGRLYGAITHAPGLQPMPQGAAKMNGCDIRRVKVWIDAGAPNN